jgi:hypothetical protein
MIKQGILGKVVQQITTIIKRVDRVLANKTFSGILGDLAKADKIWEDFRMYLSNFSEVDLTQDKQKIKEETLSQVHLI